MYRVHHLSDSEQMCGKSLQWFEITCLLMLQIMGCGLLGVGIWLLVTDFSAREITVIINSDMFEIGTYMILAGGGLVALLAFCGCCGTMREDRCILGFVSISEWYMVTVNLTLQEKYPIQVSPFTSYLETELTIGIMGNKTAMFGFWSSKVYERGRCRYS